MTTAVEGQLNALHTLYKDTHDPDHVWEAIHLCATSDTKPPW
jgi:hypothetical protein